MVEESSFQVVPAVKPTSFRSKRHMTRLLIVSEVYPEPERPQYGVFIKQQADELTKLGYEVDVLIPYRSKTHEKLRREGNVYKIGYTALRYDLFPLLGDRKGYEEIRGFIRDKYDLVAIHITSDIILKMVLQSCRNRIPVVAHYHGLNVWEEYETSHPIREKYYSSRRKRMLSEVKAIVGVSNKVTQIVKEKLPNTPVSTVYNGVDIELFHTTEKHHAGFKIIGVGNLIKIKGFQYLIEAFRQVEKPSMELHIVGTGPEEKKLQKLAEGLPITFHGKLPYDQVAKLVSESDLFVLPSFYEALGCVYLESMACGVPAVGVKGMGIDEIIEDGENGFLVRPQNVVDIMKILNKGKPSVDMCLKARKTTEKYTWEASAKSLDRVYKKVMM